MKLFLIAGILVATSSLAANSGSITGCFATAKSSTNNTFYYDFYKVSEGPSKPSMLDQFFLASVGMYSKGKEFNFLTNASIRSNGSGAGSSFLQIGETIHIKTSQHSSKFSLHHNLGSEVINGNGDCWDFPVDYQVSCETRNFLVNVYEINLGDGNLLAFKSWRKNSLGEISEDKELHFGEYQNGYLFSKGSLEIKMIEKNEFSRGHLEIYHGGKLNRREACR